MRDTRLTTFDLRGVTLTPSHFKSQFDQMMTYFMSLPNDDMLLGFRRRAGLAHPGNELGGWYNNDGSFMPDFNEIFNTFGQWLSGYARMYAITTRG